MTKPTTTENQRLPRVLIIDDSPTVLSSLRRAVESEGFIVQTAESAEEAIKTFSLMRPDIALLDLNLHEESGWDLFEKISRIAPETPVVVVTAVPNQFTTAQAAGVGALVEKPVEVPELIGTIRRLLSEDVGTRLERLVEHDPATRYVPPRDDAP